MSYPLFKDYDKSTNDVFGDDFDTKYTLKIKSAMPSAVGLTTTVAYDPTKDSKFSPKLALKWAHPSGFAFDKLEMAQDGKLAYETSLVNASPGLKLEFKGNDSNKGDISMVYQHKAATLTAEVDAINFSKASGSISAGHGRYSFGGSADLMASKPSMSTTNFEVGAGFQMKNLLFVGVRAKKNLSEYTGIMNYIYTPQVTMAGRLNYSTKTNAGVGALAAIYSHNPTTTFKAKAGTCGTINASLKQQFENKMVLVSSVEIPSSLSGLKFGVNATLG